MKEKVYIFFDEFGNSHLNFDKQGTFSHYVYTAILIKESDLEKAREIRNSISKGHFQHFDIKSKNIKNNDKGFQKRLNILDNLKKINYVVYSFVINKKELKGDGLKYKQTFIKYFQKLFIHKFADLYDAFEIFADDIGHEEFKKSLTEFINKYALQRDLFHPDRNYRLADDIKGEKLIQLADFLSGCVGKIFCASHIHPKATKLYDKLKERIFVEFFPYQSSFYYLNLPTNHNELDDKVRAVALQTVTKYLSTSRKSDLYNSEVVLNHLLLSFMVSPNRLVDTNELVTVTKRIDIRYTEQYLRLAIANLRDNGVLVVSIQGRYGYKIPNKLADIGGFYNRYLNSIIPMLRRIKKSNDILKLHTINEINMLELDESFSILTKLIGVLENR